VLVALSKPVFFASTIVTSLQIR